MYVHLGKYSVWGLVLFMASDLHTASRMYSLQMKGDVIIVLKLFISFLFFVLKNKNDKFQSHFSPPVAHPRSPQQLNSTPFRSLKKEANKRKKRTDP